MADLISPFYLHLSESPSMPLIFMFLTSQNYHAWARAMRMALKSKNKLPFINDTSPRPDEHDPLFIAWDKCNTYVVSWITHT